MPYHPDRRATQRREEAVTEKTIPREAADRLVEIAGFDSPDLEHVVRTEIDHMYRRRRTLAARAFALAVAAGVLLLTLAVLAAGAVAKPHTTASFKEKRTHTTQQDRLKAKWPGTIEAYMAIAVQVWGHEIPGGVLVTWGRTHQEMDVFCDPANTYADGTMGGCADLGADGMYGKRIHIDFRQFMKGDRQYRCFLMAHEYGHSLGWNHDDELFKAMERRAERICYDRFGTF